jgi:hypothetical protein
MKLLGKDFDSNALIDRIERRLERRGLAVEASGPISFSGMEPRVDPLAFNLSALEANADATLPLPLATHRSGAGRVVLAAKWAFRKTCQVFINEALARQRVFNGHVRDSYAQLSAEVVSLKDEVKALRQAAERRPRKAR